MAKKKQIIVAKDEDVIIAEAFVKLKKAILSHDWSLAIEAYKDVSGEEIAMESRLDKIRKSIKEETDERPKNLGKPSKVVVAQDIPEEITDEDNQSIDYKVQQEGEGKMVVITAPQNKAEEERNRQLAANKVRMKPNRRTKPFEDTTHLPPDADVIRVGTSNEPPYKRNRNDIATEE